MILAEIIPTTNPLVPLLMYGMTLCFIICFILAMIIRRCLIWFMEREDGDFRSH